jgi:hypothetical protein
MTNPLLKHPVFQNLPYQDLKNPTIDGMRSYLAKRKKKLLLFSVLLLVGTLLSVSISFAAPENLDSWLITIVCSSSAFVLYLSSKKSDMSQSEMEQILQEVKQAQETVPTNTPS